MNEYKIIDNKLRDEDFIRLFASAGWGFVLTDIVELALRNSYATFHVETNGKVIAMARLLGDGVMAFFLKDLVVDPDYQRLGIGKMLLEHVEKYIKNQLPECWRGYLELMSSKDKDGFYQKMGYTKHPNENAGAGYSKWI